MRNSLVQHVKRATVFCSYDSLGIDAYLFELIQKSAASELLNSIMNNFSTYKCIFISLDKKLITLGSRKYLVNRFCSIHPLVEIYKLFHEQCTEDQL